MGAKSSMETLMQEINPVVTLESEFEWGDESLVITVFGNFQKSNARLKSLSEKFCNQIQITSEKV